MTLSTAELSSLERQLSLHGRQMEEEYGKINYRRLIEAERTARCMTHIGSVIPGALRSKAWVATTLRRSREYTEARRQDLHDTFAARRRYLDARREAGKLRLEVVMGKSALLECGKVSVAGQLALLQKAQESKSCDLYMVEDDVVEDALRGLEIGKSVRGTVGLSSEHKDSPSALYAEYAFTSGTNNHEAWFMARSIYQRHQATFGALVQQAFAPTEMLQTFTEQKQLITS